MARGPFSKSVCAKEERNGPPSADQGLSTAKPRSSHVTWAIYSLAKPDPLGPGLPLPLVGRQVRTVCA